MPPRESLIPKLEEVLYGGFIGEGQLVYDFEDAFKLKFDYSNVTAVSSGTAALHIAYKLSGISYGDEVITTSMTAEPTNTTILNLGAKPIFADIDPQNGNICPDSINSKISKKTKAICVVHYAGYPVDILKIRKIADDNNIFLIEDCAHALGAKVGNKFIGSIGDFAIFSFQAIKHMTTLDGGMLVIKNDSLVEKSKELRWFGLQKGVPREQTNIKQAGYKFNMNNVAALIGLEQLIIIDEAIKKHKENGRFYDEAFKNIDGIEPGKIYSDSESSYWIYTLLSKKNEEIRQNLEQNGIFASKLHKPNHLHTVFDSVHHILPKLDKFYRELLHIPCGWWVSDSDRNKIAEIVCKSLS
jgi:perosamine synthetase